MFVSNPSRSMARITPQLFYSNVDAAIHWLESIFGFRLGKKAVTSIGDYIYAEMYYQESLFLISPISQFERSDSPRNIGNFTQAMHVYVDDALKFYDHLKALGLQFVVEPELTFWGDISFQILDVEGHLWTFSQHVQDADISKQGYDIRLR